MVTVKRGDIFYADLDPVLGSEQGGVRPVIIVQNNVGNTHSPTVIAVSLTSKNKAFLPTHVRIARTGGLRTASIALCEQVRTIDKSRLDGYVGRISAEEQDAVNEALAVSMGLTEEPKPPKDSVLDLTLCPRCQSNFETGGYLLIKRGWQDALESCDICHLGRGWTFGVFDRKGACA
jgi:mRNA interferase MazF